MSICGHGGILIFDENREVYLDIERTLRLLRADSGLLRLDRIIEKGFFIDSRKSLVLQLADVCDQTNLRFRWTTPP